MCVRMCVCVCVSMCVCVWLWLAECRLCLAATTHKICAHVFITVQQSAICKCVRECVCVCDLLTAYLYILLRSVLCSFVSVSQLGIHFPFTNTLAHRCPLLFLLGCCCCCCWAFAAFAYLLGICYTHLQNTLPTSPSTYLRPFPSATATRITLHLLLLFLGFFFVSCFFCYFRFRG